MEIVCAPETYRRFESSSLRQTKEHAQWACSFVFDALRKKRIRGGSREWERAFCLTKKGTRVTRQAKWTINNCPAGRAAKGANPLLYPVIIRTPIGRVLLFLMHYGRRGFEGGAASGNERFALQREEQE